MALFAQEQLRLIRVVDGSVSFSFFCTVMIVVGQK